MKTWVLLVFVAVHQSFAHHVTISDIRRLWERTAAPVRNECVLRSGVRDELIDLFYEHGLIPDDRSFKCEIYCELAKFQIINSLGEINAKSLADNFDYIDYPLAQKCSNAIESDPCEKVYLVLKCLHDELSLRFPETSSLDFKYY